MQFLLFCFSVPKIPGKLMKFMKFRYSRKLKLVNVWFHYNTNRLRNQFTVISDFSANNSENWFSCNCPIINTASNGYFFSRANNSLDKSKFELLGHLFSCFRMNSGSLNHIEPAFVLKAYISRKRLPFFLEFRQHDYSRMYVIPKDVLTLRMRYGVRSLMFLGKSVSSCLHR